MSIEKTIQSCTAVPALHDIFLHQFKALRMLYFFETGREGQVRQTVF